MKNYVIVAVDGMDVSGKETFCNKIYDMLNVINRDNKTIKILKHSFPTYDSEIGTKIKEILHKPDSERDLDELNNLFKQDRINVMTNYIKEFDSNKNIFHVLILDRCHVSTLLYSYPYDVGKAWDTFKEECGILPNINLLFLFGRFGKCKLTTNVDSVSVHQKLISAKSNKDCNEVESFQVKIDEAITDVVSVLKTYVDNLIPVPIGSNFERMSFESAALSIIERYHYDFNSKNKK